MVTEEEKKFIEAYYNLFETEPGIKSLLDQEERDRLQGIIQNSVWERVVEKELAYTKMKSILPQLMKAAVAVIVIIVTGMLFYTYTGNHRKEESQKVLAVAKQPYEHDIKPGGNKAVLTLSNGQRIVLDNISEGSLAKQGAVDVSKQDSGELVYNAQDKAAPEQILYNTLSIPLGGEYKLVLADGTKVWLNAGSSLHYPIAFKGKERNVSLSGEAYFEVADEKDQPFTVEAGNEKIQVLGTAFNVKAYENEEKIKTTLAQGAVKVTTGGESRLLRPGEQASFDPTTGRLQVSKADVEEALAWKNGLFQFNHSNIKMIMQDVARWYNVDVQYKADGIGGQNFSGIVSRYSNVSELLKRLELTGTIHFKIEERVITVTN